VLLEEGLYSTQRVMQPVGQSGAAGWLWSTFGIAYSRFGFYTATCCDVSGV